MTGSHPQDGHIPFPSPFLVLAETKPLCFLLLSILGCLLLAAGASAQTPRRYPDRGVVSAQDIAKLTLRHASGTSTADQDAGTATGTDMVVVTGSAGSGSSQYQARVNVPITI